MHITGMMSNLNAGLYIRLELLGLLPWILYWGSLCPNMESSTSMTLPSPSPKSQARYSYDHLKRLLSIYFMSALHYESGLSNLTIYTSLTTWSPLRATHTTWIWNKPMHTTFMLVVFLKILKAVPMLRSTWNSAWTKKCRPVSALPNHILLVIMCRPTVTSSLCMCEHVFKTHQKMTRNLLWRLRTL
jgi:hypothetical protein